MLSFKQFRIHTNHESRIRRIASEVRRNEMGHYFKEPKRNAQFGDCHYLSHKVAEKLSKHYPSTRVIDGDCYQQHQEGKYKGDKRGHPYPHTWIEIPEINHFVDASHDQFHELPKMRTTKDGLFPNMAVRIGLMNSAFYKDHYVNHSPSDPADSVDLPYPDNKYHY